MGREELEKQSIKSSSKEFCCEEQRNFSEQVRAGRVQCWGGGAVLGRGW